MLYYDRLGAAALFVLAMFESERLARGCEPMEFCSLAIRLALRGRSLFSAFDARRFDGAE
jgi:hypothetical protein